MIPSWVTSIGWLPLTILSSAIVWIIEFYLDVRQSRKLRNIEIPQKLAPFLDEEEFATMQSYTLVRLGFSRLESTYGYIAEIGVLLSGVLQWAWNVSLIITLWLGYTSEYQVIKGVVFLFIVSIGSAVMKLPFELYRILVIDSEFFNQNSQVLLNWTIDQLKLFILAVLGGIPVLLVALKLIQFGQTVHWIYIWGAVSVLSIFVQEIYPSVLGPMFNNFTKFPEDKPLRKKIQMLADELDFPLSEILMMDSSKRCDQANAFFTGLSTKRIVLYDNLMDYFKEDEILAILAHEIGHYKMNHSTKELALQVMSVGIFLFALSQSIYNPEFYKSFGFVDSYDPSIGLCLFSYLYGPIANALNVISNLFTRGFEYEADQFAMQKGFDMERPLIMMHVNNVYNLVVDKHYSRYYNSHPSLMERLEKIEQFKQKNK
eukprot:gb/GECH01004722.1/.p1 GENE.gb/GECH01004722.1/~~gb/GECH01004722.1/.p1  ORF type:complete len:430 (+),score=69.91 gb/GECH01004722.1/:1-1290(+)